MGLTGHMIWLELMNHLTAQIKKGAESLAERMCLFWKSCLVKRLATSTEEVQHLELQGKGIHNVQIPSVN